MCARPECGNLKDKRSWCDTCKEHINDASDPDHKHGR